MNLRSSLCPCLSIGSLKCFFVDALSIYFARFRRQIKRNEYSDARQALQQLASVTKFDTRAAFISFSNEPASDWQ